MTKQQIITPVLIVAIVGSIAVLASPTTSAVASDDWVSVGRERSTQLSEERNPV